jgi:fructokinase
LIKPKEETVLYDVVTLGELLIDFSPSGKGEMGNPAFEMNPGGAPGNCLAAVARLGGATAFIGMVGNDLFGNFILSVLKDTGIETKGIHQTAKAPTTLAFVSIDDKGERDFSFVRKPGADIMLDKRDISFDLIDNARIFHFGSLSLTDQPARNSTYTAANHARKKGKLISYDPNYREPLWKNRESALRYMKEGLEYADIVKMSEVELELLTGFTEVDVYLGMNAILNKGKKAVYVTAGAKGAYFATHADHGFVEGFRVKAVDTTGCGDAFTGAILYQICCCSPGIGQKDMVRYANAAGALCATKYGGIPAMPDRAEVEALLSRQAAGD